MDTTWSAHERVGRLARHSVVNLHANLSQKPTPTRPTLDLIKGCDISDATTGNDVCARLQDKRLETQVR